MQPKRLRLSTRRPQLALKPIPSTPLLPYPPSPAPQVWQTITEDFGKAPDQLFKEFGREPIASASLAQVHEAIDHDGRRLAVKVGGSTIQLWPPQLATPNTCPTRPAGHACAIRTEAALPNASTSPLQVQHRGLREASAIDLATIDVLVKVR